MCVRGSSAACLAQRHIHAACVGPIRCANPSVRSKKAAPIHDPRGSEGRSRKGRQPEPGVGWGWESLIVQRGVGSSPVIDRLGSVSCNDVQDQSRLQACSRRGKTCHFDRSLPFFFPPGSRATEGRRQPSFDRSLVRGQRGNDRGKNDRPVLSLPTYLQQQDLSLPSAVSPAVRPPPANPAARSKDRSITRGQQQRRPSSQPPWRSSCDQLPNDRGRRASLHVILQRGPACPVAQPGVDRSICGLARAMSFEIQRSLEFIQQSSRRSVQKVMVDRSRDRSSQQSTTKSIEIVP